MTTKKNTIVQEAKELMEKELHALKVRKTAKILVQLQNLTADYEKRKKELEENLKEVDSMVLIQNEETALTYTL